MTNKMVRSFLAVCVFIAVLQFQVDSASISGQYSEDSNGNEYYDNVDNVVAEKRRRGLDPMSGITFGGLKKRYDSLRNMEEYNEADEENVGTRKIRRNPNKISTHPSHYVRQSMSVPVVPPVPPVPFFYYQSQMKNWPNVGIEK